MRLKDVLEPMEATGKVVYDDGSTNVPTEEFPTDVFTNEDQQEFPSADAEELFCTACERRFMQVQELVPDWEAADDGSRQVRIAVLCPNCAYSTTIVRECDEAGRVTVGYPVRDDVVLGDGDWPEK